MDLTSDETDVTTRAQAPSGELEFQNLLDQLQTVQLQVPFASTRYRLSKSWLRTKNYFHPQRKLIMEDCQYVAKKFQSEKDFRLKLLLFALILKNKASPQQKDESILEISKEWSSLKPMIKKHLESDKIDHVTKDKMEEILFGMEEYKKSYSHIFDKIGSTGKDSIKDDKKSHSKTTKTERIRDDDDLPKKNRKDDDSPRKHRERNHYDDDSPRKHRERNHYDDDSSKKNRHRGLYDDDSPRRRRSHDDSPKRHRFHDDSPKRHRFHDDSPRRRRFHDDSPRRRRFYDDSPRRHRFNDYNRLLYAPSYAPPTVHAQPHPPFVVVPYTPPYPSFENNRLPSSYSRF